MHSVSSATFLISTALCSSDSEEEGQRTIHADTGAVLINTAGNLARVPPLPQRNASFETIDASYSSRPAAAQRQTESSLRSFRAVTHFEPNFSIEARESPVDLVPSNSFLRFTTSAQAVRRLWDLNTEQLFISLFLDPFSSLRTIIQAHFRRHRILYPKASHSHSFASTHSYTDLRMPFASVTHCPMRSALGMQCR